MVIISYDIFCKGIKLKLNKRTAMRPLLFTEQGEFYHKNLLFQQKDEPFKMIHLLKEK